MCSWEILDGHDVLEGKAEIKCNAQCQRSISSTSKLSNCRRKGVCIQSFHGDDDDDDDDGRTCRMLCKAGATVLISLRRLMRDIIVSDNRGVMSLVMNGT